MERFSAAAPFCGGVPGSLLIRGKSSAIHPSRRTAARPVEHFKRQSRSIQQPLKSTESRIPVNDLAGKRPPAVNQLECHIPDAWHMPRVRNASTQRGRSLPAQHWTIPTAVLRLQSAAAVIRRTQLTHRSCSPTVRLWPPPDS